MNVYYAGGATHNDHHKELTIGGNVTAEALKQIMAKFFDDDSDSEGFVSLSPGGIQRYSVYIKTEGDKVCRGMRYRVDIFVY